jgi:hypothetical protein
MLPVIGLTKPSSAIILDDLDSLINVKKESKVEIPKAAATPASRTRLATSKKRKASDSSTSTPFDGLNGEELVSRVVAFVSQVNILLCIPKHIPTYIC